ncbi:MAG: glycogen-binding domain-containing protein [Gemmatimonadota bacterium]
MRASWTGAAVVVLVLAGSSTLHAQWFASAVWGAAEDLDVATGASTQSLQLGLARAEDVLRFSITGGIPTRPQEDSSWGIVDVFVTPRVGGPREGLQFDLRGTAFAYHNPITDAGGSGGLLQVEPYATRSTRSYRLRLGGGGRISGTTTGGIADNRMTGVIAADFLTVPAPGLAIEVRAETLFQDSLTLPHGQLALAYDYGTGVVWAGVDRWTSDSMRETGWYVGASLDLTESLSARSSVGQTSGEPIFGSPPRQTWSVGLAYRFGDRHPIAVKSTALPEFGPGPVILRVAEEEGAGIISVAGSFNGWVPTPMTRRGNAWTIELDLEPGVYAVAFVDESGRWFVPESMPGRRSDGMGGFTAVLVVR